MRVAWLVAIIAACGGDVDGDTGEPLGVCEGGGAAGLMVGSGGMSGFGGWGDGDAAELTLDSAGAAGFRLEFNSDGLDTNESVNAVVAISFPGRANSETYLAGLSLQCDEGPGWAATFAPLPDDVAVAGLDAATIDIVATMTDHRGISATTSVAVVVRDAT